MHVSLVSSALCHSIDPLWRSSIVNVIKAGNSFYSSWFPSAALLCATSCFIAVVNENHSVAPTAKKLKSDICLWSGKSGNFHQTVVTYIEICTPKQQSFATPNWKDWKYSPQRFVSLSCSYKSFNLFCFWRKLCKRP